MNTIKHVMYLILIAVVLGACGEGKPPEDQKSAETEMPATSASNVQVVRATDLLVKTIKNTTVKSHLPITGRVIPKYTTQLVAEVQGRILSSEKSFKAGTTFRKGEVLLQLDSREFALNLESQKSAFLNILTGLMPDLKSDYPENYQNWLNYVNNYKTGKPLPPLPQTASKPEKYFVTSRQVYTTYYNIKAQEDRLSKFTLVAPFSGSLSSTTIDTGGLVSPGQPLGTFISDGNYELETAVSIELGSTLKIGQQIEFESRALGQTFTATVSRINNIVDPTTQNIPVFLRIRDSRLRSGMYLEGKVVSTSFQNAINIPSSTVNRDNTVHILNNGIISKAPVEIVGQTEDEVIVRGLEDEVKLVLTTFDYPIAGLKIAQ